MRSWSFAKGHGALNDFVILPDRQAQFDPTPRQVRWLCHRRAGVGGDGLLRVTPADCLPQWRDRGDLWFMDYRNADGSLAEICGNGLRVFVRYLLEEGWVSGDQVEVVTRAGSRRAVVEPDGRISVELGCPVWSPEPVPIGAAGRIWAGRVVDVGNPHCVVRLDRTQALDQLDLTRTPRLPSDRFPDGGNLEFVVRLGPERLRARVWERGVGETRSCGTGAVAIAVDSLAGTGGGPGRRQIELPGGQLEVRIDRAGQASLIGPAVIQARGEVQVPCD
ncbi:MAG: diaminopimelate epimerase [Propionibacteriaceae bacterium]|jgi:diaminopimelate epimerase|nr:diaminopimelate epimerase [Propionibacteriaceae bacterium]